MHQYKDKQIRGLHLKLQIIEEQKRKYQVKKDILSLEESGHEKKIDLEKHLIEYEIIDLQLQQMLLLLRVKKGCIKNNLAPFIKIMKYSIGTKKYAGTRYLLVDEEIELSTIEIHMLEQNEIIPLLPIQLIQLQNVVEVDPAQYHNRAEMEVAIQRLLKRNSESNIVFKSIKSLKELELKTIEQINYQLTALAK